MFFSMTHVEIGMEIRDFVEPPTRMDRFADSLAEMQRGFPGCVPELCVRLMATELRHYRQGDRFAVGNILLLAERLRESLK